MYHLAYETFIINEDGVCTIHPNPEQEMELQDEWKESQHILVQGLIDRIWDVVESNKYHFEVKVTKDKGQSTWYHYQRHPCREGATHENNEHEVSIVVLNIKSIRSHDIFHALLSDLFLSPPFSEGFFEELNRHRNQWRLNGHDYDG